MSSTRKFSKLHNARVLILGGTAGIGFAVAEGSLEGGAVVIIASSNPDRLASALIQLKTAYPDTAGRITGRVCDLSKPDTLEANVKDLLLFATEGNTRKLDHAVFTAGDLPKYGPIEEYQPSDTVSQSATIRHDGGIVIGKLAPAFMNPGPRCSSE